MQARLGRMCDRDERGRHWASPSWLARIDGAPRVHAQKRRVRASKGGARTRVPPNAPHACSTRGVKRDAWAHTDARARTRAGRTVPAPRAGPLDPWLGGTIATLALLPVIWHVSAPVQLPSQGSDTLRQRWRVMAAPFPEGCLRLYCRCVSTHASLRAPAWARGVLGCARGCPTSFERAVGILAFHIDILACKTRCRSSSC